MLKTKTNAPQVPAVEKPLTFGGTRQQNKEAVTSVKVVNVMAEECKQVILNLHRLAEESEGTQGQKGTAVLLARELALAVSVNSTPAMESALGRAQALVNSLP
jgi:hypothetical protein